MKVTLNYGAYSSNIENATVPMEVDTDTLKVSTIVSTDGDSGAITKKLELNVIESLSSTEHKLVLSTDEVKQFITLLSLFNKQIEV